MRHRYTRQELESISVRRKRMTIDEAIKNREDCLKYLEEIGPKASHDCLEAVRWSVKALKALRPVSREQVEKVWRGEWIGMTDDDGCTWYECSRCEHDLDSLEDPNHFCPACGAPMTDEAVEMVMERWKEAVVDEA